MDDRKISLFGMLLLCAVVPARILAQQRTGSISGMVVDEAGAPIAGAAVWYGSVRSVKRGPPGEPELAGPVVNGGVRCDSSGSFLIAGLQAANYTLCGQGPSGSHLSSCRWGGRGYVASVKPGATLSKITLISRTATLVQMAVQDANGRIAAGAKFFPGVLSLSGYYGRFRLQSVTSTRLSYVLAVPKQTTFRLIFSTGLNLTDSSGAPVGTGTAAPQFSTAQESQVTLNINVQ